MDTSHLCVSSVAKDSIKKGTIKITGIDFNSISILTKISIKKTFVICVLNSKFYL